MLKKEEVFVRVSSEKKARKLKELLEMFGEEETHPQVSINSALKNGGFICYTTQWTVGWCWTDESTLIRRNLKEVSLKELRNILAVEHLKDGDVIVCKDDDEISLGVFKEWESQFGFDLDNVYYLNDPECHSQGHGGCFGNFIRYATEEEKSLLEPKKELEIGKWYFIENKNCSTRKTDALVFIKEFKGDDNTNYGFDSKGDWTDKFWADNLKNMGRIVEATPEEVEQALIKEAKMRYKVGDLIEKISEWNIGNYPCDNKENSFKIRYVEDIMYSDNILSYGNLIVFKNGKWAEVIKTEKSLEERVKELEDFIFGVSGVQFTVKFDDMQEYLDNLNKR